MTKLKHILGLLLLAATSVSAQQAAKLGADLTPMGGEKAGNAAGTIPAWTGGITSAAQAGAPGFKSGGHHPDPVREREAALQGRCRERSEVRRQPHGRAQGAAERLQGQLLHERLPVAPQRRVPAAHL